MAESRGVYSFSGMAPALETIRADTQARLGRPVTLVFSNGDAELRGRPEPIDGETERVRFPAPKIPRRIEVREERVPLEFSQAVRRALVDHGGHIGNAMTRHEFRISEALTDLEALCEGLRRGEKERPGMVQFHSRRRYDPPVGPHFVVEEAMLAAWSQTFDLCRGLRTLRVAYVKLSTRGNDAATETTHRFLDLIRELGGEELPPPQQVPGLTN